MKVMRHQTTFHHAVLVRCGIAAIALAALLGWGAGSSPASVDARLASSTRAHPGAATRSGTSRSASGMAIDRRIARDARLRLSDLPPGWTSDNTASLPTADAPCPGLRRAAGAISAGTISPVFSISAGEILTAQSEAYIYANTATAKHWFAEFSSRGTRACLARLLRKELTATARAEGFALGPITLRSLARAPVGDQDAAFRVIVPVSGSGVALKVDADVVFVRAGRGIEIFALAGVGSPFDPALEASVVKTVTDRLTADLRTAS